VKTINRLQNSKIIANSSLLIIFFYVFLAVLSFGFLNTSLPGLKVAQLLFIPIIAGILGFARAAYNFSFDEIISWEKGKTIYYSLIISSAILVLSQVFLITAGSDEGLPIHLPLYYIGIISLILSSCSFTISFFFVRKQLSILYFKKVVIRHPGIYLLTGYIFQIIAYCIYFVSFFFNNQSIQGIMDIIGVSVVAASLLMLAIGFFQINISFRAYPHLVEDESIRP